MVNGQSFMNNLLHYLDAAYLINLPERKDRLRAAKKELARAGWNLDSGSVQLFAARRFSDRAGFPSPEVRGCFQSHLDCIRAAYQQGKKSVLMIEDDFALTSAITRLTASIIAQLEATRWDFCYFGHEYTGPIPLADLQTTEVKLCHTALKSGPRTVMLSTDGFFHGCWHISIGSQPASKVTKSSVRCRSTAPSTSFAALITMFKH